jgi:hypothetical protein
MSEEQRAKFAMSGAYDHAKGEFEILAITAGMGNGWDFTEDALKESVPLWDGVDSFVDHGSFFERRSVRDLGGVGHSPAWDDVVKGIKLKLRTCGPSGPFMEALGREMCAELSVAETPRVGFSADVVFTATGSDVQQILRVISLDIVYDPARGGAFVRALNSVQPPRRGKEDGMGDEAKVINTPAPEKKEGGGGVVEKLNADLKAIQDMAGVQAQLAKIGEEVEAARALRVAMCGQLLDAGLSASKLPASAAARVRAQFTGTLFDAIKLQEAIEDARKLVAELTAGSMVVGVQRVHAMFNSADQLQAAVDDLLDAPREKGAESLKVARLSGIRQLYQMYTGDEGFHGGVYPERVQLNTGSFTNLVVNAMNKAMVQRWGELGRAGYLWWDAISHKEHFTDLKQITWLISGTVATLPTVAKGAEYTPLMIGDGKENSSFVKYGGYVGIDLEDMINDDTRRLRLVPKELANAALRNISALCAAIFTDNSAVGPTLADTGALFNATAVTTAGGHKNLLTTALSAAEWEVVSAAVYNQPMLVSNDTGYIGTGKKAALDPRFLLVPRVLRLTAKKILYPQLENTSNITSENQQRGEAGDVVVVPEWTDANDWAAVVDPLLMPGICIGEAFGIMPEIFVAGDELSPAVFMNDESRIKVRHWIAVGVADYRPLHKSNVV